jgi:nucleoside diphosphate kinase
MSTNKLLQDFAIDVGRNVCHGSDSVENAKKEVCAHPDVPLSLRPEY